MKISHGLLGMILLGLAVMPAMAEDAVTTETTDQTQSSDLRDDWREIRQDRREIYRDRGELRQDYRELRADRQEGDREEFREDMRELREDRAEYRDDRGELCDDKKDLRREIRDSLTEEEKARMKALHEQHPNLNRKQLYRAVKNPEKFQKRQEWLTNYKNAHPDAAPEQIRLAAKQERHDKIVQKIREKHPEATEEQISQMLEERKEARQERSTKRQPCKADDKGKKFKKNHSEKAKPDQQGH